MTLVEALQQAERTVVHNRQLREALTRLHTALQADVIDADSIAELDQAAQHAAGVLDLVGSTNGTSDEAPEPEPAPPAADNTGTKRCPDCKRTEPDAEFGKNRASYDGKQPYCKPCQSARSRASRQRSRKRRAQSAGADGDKEGSSVPAVLDLPRPAPTSHSAPPAPPAADERTCADCSKTLPLASFRMKPTGRSKKCIVCDGAERVPGEGPPPLPGQTEFTTTVVCDTCPHEDITKHPHADEPDAITAATVRVDQALHRAVAQCGGTLSGTWAEHVHEAPLPEVHPRRSVTEQLSA